MSIITKSDFRGEIVIANKSDAPITEGLQWFIDKYEPKFLNSLLGSDFATLFIAGIAVDPTDARWTNLLNQPDFKLAIASYIYYFYMANEDRQTMSVGTVKTKNANAVLSSANKKVTRAWNEMVTANWNTTKFLIDNPTIYPEYVQPNFYAVYSRFWFGNGYINQGCSDIFMTINTFGL